MNPEIVPKKVRLPSDGSVAGIEEEWLFRSKLWPKSNQENQH
jgi:hypothetical protein